jgi:hypothetical protein
MASTARGGTTVLSPPCGHRYRVPSTQRKEGEVQHTKQQRVAGAIRRLGVTERRSPRWVEAANGNELAEYGEARNALVAR